MKKTLITRWTLRFSTRLYQMLLLVYPAEFRRAYGEPMLQVFRDCCRRVLRESGLVGLLALWGRTILDTMQTAIEEHSQRDVEMNRKKFVRLSGWALVMAAVSLLLMFLPEVGDIASTLPPIFDAPDAAAQIQRAAVFARALPLPLAILLITFGLLGLLVRYGEAAGGAAKAALVLGISGGALSLVSFGLMLSGLVDGRPAVNISMGIMFSGLFFFGLVAWRQKLLKWGNGLPALAGVWWPALVIQAYVFPQLTQSFGPAVPGWLSLSIFAVLSFFLAWLGYVVQAEAAQMETAAFRKEIEWKS